MGLRDVPLQSLAHLFRPTTQPPPPPSLGKHAQHTTHYHHHHHHHRFSPCLSIWERVGASRPPRAV
jgi:hypothetical protein